MAIKKISMKYFQLTILVVAGIVIATVLYPERQPADGIRRFNFAPHSAPRVESFKTISADSDYNRWRGYGWIDAAGPLETGRWQGDEAPAWESRSNLNVIARRGPDDLARSYATGPASFALDLVPGRYEVWVLSGDAGYLEYIPRVPYKITVEGEVAYSFDISPDEFIRQFESPVYEDVLSHADVWRQAVAPRFRWSRVEVDVEDGQLTVNVDGEQLDNSVLELMGDYAHTEIRDGPAQRFSGALNALVVVPVAPDAPDGLQAINAINTWRQQNIRHKWPLVEPGREPATRLAPVDYGRGYTVCPVSVQNPVMPHDMCTHSEAVIMLRATAGEFVPITFAITPLTDLGETRVDFETLQSLPGTAGSPIPVADNLTSGVVRYAAVALGKQRAKWRPQPALIVPANHWNLHEGISKQFWLTYRVPEDLLPGQYTGTIGIHPEHATDTHLAVQLEVLPFKLQRPAQLAIGMTYFSPVQYAATDEQDFWKRMQAEFADMRAHNMTSVQYTGIRMDDYERMDRALTLYRNAGFEQPVNLLESHGAMERWRRRGIPWSSAEFLTEYVQFVHDFLQQAERRQWPPVIIDFGDEFTNRALEEVGAEIAKHLKEITGIVTAADVNGYKEMALLAPEVDIVAFNNGWDGPEHINRGKRLLNKDTVDHILDDGATPWLVNVGMDRFSNGYWFWKMVRLGVRGKMEWMYRGYNGMPFNNFDAEPLRAHAVYPGPDGTAIPSLDYERMRIGLDDLAYLYTLEQALAKARGDAQRESAVTAADAFIGKLDSMIEADMGHYRGDSAGDGLQWPVARYDALRNEVIELILRLHEPQEAP